MGHSAETAGHPQLIWFQDLPQKDGHRNGAGAAGSGVEDGTEITCSEAALNGMTGENECCGECKKYIKKVMNAASKIYDEEMKTYIPYLRKVTSLYQ